MPSSSPGGREESDSATAPAGSDGIVTAAAVDAVAAPGGVAPELEELERERRTAEGRERVGEPTAPVVEARLAEVQ